MSLKIILEKEFIVNLEIDELFDPSERSFFTRVGALSRTLKELGMYELLSPHNKLFSLRVEKGNMPNVQIQDKGVEKAIRIDYSGKLILIPLKMASEFSIVFYS